MTKLLLVNKVIFYSKILMFGTFVGFVVCLLVTYSYPEYFSITVQITGHILTIVFAGIFKVSLVSLMAAKKEVTFLTSSFNLRTEPCCNLKS